MYATEPEMWEIEPTHYLDTPDPSAHEFSDKYDIVADDIETRQEHEEVFGERDCFEAECIVCEERGYRG